MTVPPSAKEVLDSGILPTNIDDEEIENWVLGSRAMRFGVFRNRGTPRALGHWRHGGVS